MKGCIAGLLLVLAACGEAPLEREPGAQEPEAEPRPWQPAPVREGGALVRGAYDEALYVADEDHAVLRIVPLPFGSDAPETVPLPGRPAQVLALDDRILVTIRDPGLLVSFERERRELVQSVPLPADAWGLAVTPDERTALVTSAWAHALSAVDLASGTVRWTVDLAREPRGVVVLPDGERAYVTHLVGADVTRIDGIASDAPLVARVPLPAGRFSAPVEGAPEGYVLGASLAYAAVLSPDAERLFVPRHALGGVGWAPWFGRSVVDVLLVRDDTPLAPPRTGGLVDRHPFPDVSMVEDGSPTVALPLQWTVQPRAAVYRRSTATLIVASEGQGRIAELDARALDPSLHPVYRYELVHDGKDAERCGAPTGVALAADESTAYVWCRTTGEVASVPLKPGDFVAGPDAFPDPPRYLRVADDPLDGGAATGRRLFYDARHDDARNHGVSGGLGCAGCHPDGRDDGHVWMEDPHGGLVGGPVPRSIPRIDVHLPGFRSGLPRQTPMLAGRVGAVGPYGWLGEDRTLVDRILVGFGLHRWNGARHTYLLPAYRPHHEQQAEALAAFLREGLVPPPLEHRALTPVEARGSDLFHSDDTQCAFCHVPERDFTSRQVVALALGPSAIAPDLRDGPGFRVPSLLYVGGTAPYYHDGRSASLAELVAGIGDGMGATASLSAEDRAALVAYLATIGLVDDVPARGEALAAQPFPFPPRIEDGAAVPATDEAPWVETSSPRPSRAEWDEASELELPRTSDGCRVWRVREWLRVHCLPDTTSGGPTYYSWVLPQGEREPTFRVGLIAGDVRGVDLSYGIVFPVRRGDRRLFEIDREITTSRICSKYRDWMQAATFTISESWLDHEPSPSIVITRYGRHPSTGTTYYGDRCG
jgi:mono/diheme cytochrome c family protein